MTRRNFVQAAGALAAARPSAAAANPHGSMLWDHIVGAIRDEDANRAARLAALKTPAQLRMLQREVRARLAEMWGAFPAGSSPLNARLIGTLDRGDHVVEKIVYESRPSFHVTANLYRPKQAAGRLPAIVFPPGHSKNGKAAGSYQRFAILMARNGFVVLSIDCIGQGERLQLWDPVRHAAPAAPGTAEHNVLGRQCYLVGVNLMQYRAWDTIRGVDYLESRPDVDPARIGLAGQSGGGMETLQVAPFETRFQASASVCAVATFRYKTEALLIADAEQNLFGTLGYGIDHPELLSAVAPRALMIGSSIRDYVPIAGARRTFAELRPVFATMGVPDKVTMAETDDRHGFNAEMRRSVTRFFLQSLAKGKEEVAERESELPPERELWCTRSGQVTEDFGGETVYTLNRRLADGMTPKRPLPRTAGQFETYRREIEMLAQRITRLDLNRAEPRIVRPSSTFGAQGNLVLLFSETGKDDASVQREVVQPLVSAGYRILGVDVRGWGETRPYVPGKQSGEPLRPSKFSWDDFFAYRSMELGWTLFGQRLRDVLVSAQEAGAGVSWTAVGIGVGALLVAHAAVLDPRFRRVALVHPLLSYRSLIDDAEYKYPFAAFLPGVIGAYEVRDLLAAIAPRQVLVINPEDARRRPVNHALAAKELDWSTQVHRTMHSSFELQCGLEAERKGQEIGRWLRA